MEPLSMNNIELSIVMPCLNEVETIGRCIEKARCWLEQSDVKGEIVIGDNGSTDGSQEIAIRHGARVVAIAQRGYGAALYGATMAAQGQYIIMGDSDDSYDFSNLSPFLEKLREGYDLVMGNRFKGGIQPGAMPWKNRHIGNPLLTRIGQILFNCSVGDFHCGLRGFSKAAFLQMDLHTTGMEYASEMVIKAGLLSMRIAEVPTILSKDGRSRPPHLRPWRDGWRHLRFMLLFSPRWLFLYPGLVLFFVGMALLLWLLPGPRHLLGIYIDIHTMLFGSAAMILGIQSLSFALFAKLYGVTAGFLPSSDRLVKLLTEFRLERGLVLGLGLFLAGIGGSIYAFYLWGMGAFGELVPNSMMRLIIPSVTATVVGIQLGLSAFMLSVLKIPARNRPVRQDPPDADCVRQSCNPVNR